MGPSGQVCKKCGYERQASDTAAETECPKCGAIYAKVEQHLERLKAEAAKRQEAEEQHQQRLNAEAAKRQEAEEKRQRRQTEQKQALINAVKGDHARAMASRALKASFVVVVLAVAAYWYWSPFLAVHQLRTAAREGDADSFNDFVDYPRLRESLKGQFSAMMADKLGGAANGGSDAARAGSALGAMLGMNLVDRMVDTMVRPEFVMKSMQEGRFAVGRGGEATGVREMAKINTDIGNLKQALKLYKRDNGVYPSTWQGLQALVTRPTVGKMPPNWKPYLDRLPLDPWGRAYQYWLSASGDIGVASAGPTGTVAVTATAEPSPARSWSSERKGVNKAIFHLKDKEDESGKAPAIVLERSGFATWKITEVRLPLNK